MSELLKLSVSKTKTFLDCRKKFKYSYIEKLPKKDRDYHIFGKFCHKVLEDFHLYYINGCVDPLHVSMTRAYKAALSEYQDKMTQDMKDECKVIIDKYLRLITENKKNNTLPNVLACEKDFYLELNDKVILNGMIDRIQIDADNVVHVCDYKTTKNKKYLKNDFFQLLTYAYVIIMQDPTITKVRGSYILLRHNFEYVTVEFNAPEIMAIKDKYVEYANQMFDEKDYPAKTSKLCKYCDYISICDEGIKTLRDDEMFGEVSW